MTAENTSLFAEFPEDLLTDEELNDPTGFAEALVGEGKKYKTADDLAKAALFKDKHIGRIERENAELRSKVTNESTIAQLLEKLDAKSSVSQEGSDETKVETPPAPKPVRPEELVAQVLQELENRSSVAKQNENLRSVQTALASVFGRDYTARLDELVRESEFPKDTLDDLAKKSPKAFFRALGINPDQKQSSNSLFSPPPSSVFDAGKQTNTRVSGVRDDTFYKKLKKDDPKRYNSTEVQVARMRDAERLGSAFFSN